MNKIILEGDIILKTVDALAAQLSAVLQDKEVLEVTLHNTSKWDVAGIQMLYAFKKYHALQQKVIVFNYDETDAQAHVKQLVEMLNTQKINKDQ